MKVNFHYHFYSRIFISLLIFACGFFLWQKSVDTRALVGNVYTDGTPIVGWAWNDKMGWIALNCANDFNGDGEPDGGTTNNGTSWWGSCINPTAGNGWGLKMSSVDNDGNSATPNLNYVKGCAWAGGIAAEKDAGGSLPVGAEYTSPGWICFSNPGNTAAPENGVSMSEASIDISSCQCEMTPGICDGPVQNNLCINSRCSMTFGSCDNKVCSIGGPPGGACNYNRDCYISCTVANQSTQCVNQNSSSCTDYLQCSGLNNITWQGNTCIPNYCDTAGGLNKCKLSLESCTTNADCPVRQECLKTHDSCTTNADCPTWTNDCVNNICYTSKESCTYDSDCEYACRNDSDVNFLIKGVCFDGSAAQQNILNTHRGHKPPFDDITAQDSTMTSCYINSDCYSLVGGDPDDAECVYPQIGSPAPGKGDCKKTSTGSIQPGSSGCAYYFDCDYLNGYGCFINMSSDLVDIPDSCDINFCTAGYTPITTTLTTVGFINALNPYIISNESFASIIKMESVTTTPGYEDANKIGFSIDNEVKILNSGNYVADTYADYDVDNPNNNWTNGNDNNDNPLRGCFNCYQEKSFKCTTSGASCTCDQSEDSCVDINNACEDGPDTDDSCSLSALAPPVCENCQEYFYYTKDQNTCSIRTDWPCATVGSSCANDFGTCLAHKEGDLKKVLTGFNCSDCIVDNYANSCSLNSLNTNSNRCQKCATFNGGADLISNYTLSVYRMGGVLYDNQHGRSSTSTLCGWGYNAWQGLSGKEGFGWFNFSPRISTSTKPYFSVEKGNIYSKGRIKTLYQPPINKYNASYLIEAGGDIRNFVSEASKSATTTSSFQGELPNRPIINFLTPILGTNNYKNALGKLDYQGLTTVVDIGTGKNKYGSEIIDLPAADLNTIFEYTSNNAGPMNNKVFNVLPDNNFTYHYVGDDTQNLVIKAGSGSNSNGAGIIVINGNLKIIGNIKYDTSSVITNIKQIPSLVWIVKGDVEIEADVTDLAGTFIVLGDGVQNCYTSDPSSRAPQNCGQFLSVHYNTSTGQYMDLSSAGFLKVDGNVLARKFVLVRQKTDLFGTPAEQFINNGRLQTNPPLGLKDMSKVIPRFSSY